jgi:hypothetical protein
MAKLIIENHHGGTLTAVSSAEITRFICTIPMEGPR